MTFSLLLFHLQLQDDDIIFGSLNYSVSHLHAFVPALPSPKTPFLPFHLTLSFKAILGLEAVSGNLPGLPATPTSVS